MKDLAKIFGYLAAVIVLGALLAPPLYWTAHWLAGHGIFPVLAKFKFQKFFNRAAVVSAVILIWPTIRWLKIGGWRQLGLAPDPRWRQHLLAGFFIAALAVAVMAFAYIQLGLYRWRTDPAGWGKFVQVALAAVGAPLVEEALFRGAILGLLRRSLRPYHALVWVSALFAAVHFLKPDEAFDPGPVGWLTGFALVPHSFHRFADPTALLAGFTTLFALGWLCGEAALRTRALWMSIGLHAGVVFVKMNFEAVAKFAVKAKDRDGWLPWVDDRFENGLVPVAVLLVAWGAVRLWLAYENRHDIAARG